MLPTDQFYKTKMCPHKDKPEGCIRKLNEQCPYAHDVGELRSSPNLLKTAMCKLHLKQNCTKTSSECPFAHQYEELRHTDGFYKIYVCKFWTKGHCKAGNLCRFAHGSEELRRMEEDLINEGIIEDETNLTPKNSNDDDEKEYIADENSVNSTRCTNSTAFNVSNDNIENGFATGKTNFNITPIYVTDPYPYNPYYTQNTNKIEMDYNFGYHNLNYNNQEICVNKYNEIFYCIEQGYEPRRTVKCNECYHLFQYHLHKFIDCCTRQYHKS